MLWRRTLAGVVVRDAEGGEARGLSPTAGTVWLALDHDRAETEVTREIADALERDHAEVADEVAAALGFLAEQGLVERVERAA